MNVIILLIIGLMIVLFVYRDNLGQLMHQHRNKIWMGGIVIGLVLVYFNYSHFMQLYLNKEIQLPDVLSSTLTSAPVHHPVSSTVHKQKRTINGYKKRLLASSQEWKCGHCKQILDPAYEVDHIIPLSQGGTNDDSNLLCLCRKCHGIKTFQERA